MKAEATDTMRRIEVEKSELNTRAELLAPKFQALEERRTALELARKEGEQIPYSSVATQCSYVGRLGLCVESLFTLDSGCPAGKCSLPVFPLISSGGSSEGEPGSLSRPRNGGRSYRERSGGGDQVEGDSCCPQSDKAGEREGPFGG